MELKKYFHNHPEWIFYILGFCIVIIGLIYAIWIWLWISLGWASIIISFGVALIVLGISKKSGEMTHDIAFSSLYDVLGLLNERRLGIRRRLKLLKSNSKLTDSLDYELFYCYSVWLCLTYLRRVDIFNKYFKENDEDKIIHEIDCLFQDFCDGKLTRDINLVDVYNYIRNLEEMYEIISKYDRFNKDTLGEKLRRDRIWNNLKYLKGLASLPIYFEKHR